MNNDLISRSGLLAEYDCQHTGTPGKARGLILSAPAVDAVEVVRCENCQYVEPYMRIDGQTGYYCNHPKNTFIYFKPLKDAGDFCNYGERRTE